MVSYCLKSIDKNILDKLELYFDTSKIPNIFYSQKKFKKFYNLIIHYTGSNIDIFLKDLTKNITNFIVENYENKFLLSQLKYDFFYFSAKERNMIYTNTLNTLNTNEIQTNKICILQDCIYNFNKSCTRYNIDGLINFRIYTYKNFLKSILEKEVHNFVVEKEYSEYVSLLNAYIKVQQPQTDTVHLIYTENEKMLLDSLENVITSTASKKYLSDISFSTNDFILNSLLSLMPKNIVIHLHCEEDNFVKFLKMIFENRYTICKNCSTCSKHKKNANHNLITTNK